MFYDYLTYTTQISDTEESHKLFIITRDFNFLNTVRRILKGNQEREKQRDMRKRKIRGNYVTLTVKRRQFL